MLFSIHFFRILITFPCLVLLIVQLFACEQRRFEKIGVILEELRNCHFQGSWRRKTVGR